MSLSLPASRPPAAADQPPHPSQTSCAKQFANSNSHLAHQRKQLDVTSPRRATMTHEMHRRRMCSRSARRAQRRHRHSLHHGAVGTSRNCGAQSACCAWWPLWRRGAPLGRDGVVGVTCTPGVTWDDTGMVFSRVRAN
jgi:hypothetical protein